MHVTSSMYFLSRSPLYDEEKPYRLKYTPPAELPPTNIETEKFPVVVRDIREYKQEIGFGTTGFELLPLKSSMAYEDFDDNEKIEQVYLAEVAELLKSKLKASRVQIFEHLVRKRHPDFPYIGGEEMLYKQPTTVAHIDMTTKWATTMARRLNHKIGLGDVPSQNYYVWKPLRGQVKDWPLALCDRRTVTPNALQDGDVVFDDFVIENKLLQQDPAQEWYYASNQATDEVWAFVQADSNDHSGTSGVPHTSFLHPKSAESQFPRESIEVRAIVFYS